MTRQIRLLLVTAALAAAAAWLFLRPPDPGHVEPQPAASSAVSSPVPDSGNDGLRATEKRQEPEIDLVEAVVPLDATLEVELVEWKSKAPIPGVSVRASLNFYAANYAGRGLEIWRTATTGADGVATFERFPHGRSVTMLTGAEGYRSATRDVSFGRLETSKRIRFELRPGLSAEKSAVRVTLPAGVTLPGIGVHYLDRTNGGVGHASREAAIVLDDDPDAPAEHDVELQLVLPGYAGERVVHRLRRGTSFELSPPKGERVAQEIALVDEEGRGVESLAVSVWPTASTGSSARFTELTGTTDARGVVTFEGYRGTEWRLDADATRVQFPDRSDQRPFVVGGTRPTFQVGRRVPHRLLFDGQGLLAHGRAELVWRSYAPTPGSALENLLRDEPARFGDRIRRYVEQLPPAVEWNRLPTGGLAAELALLPGTYLMTASTDRLFGRETTLEPVRAGDETVVPLARSRPIRVKIEGSFDRSDGPLPFRTIVLGHRAGWDERAEIGRVLGETWSATAARGPLPNVSDFEMAHFARMDQDLLALARRQAPLIGRDLGYVGADGVATLEALEAPRGVTVLLPNLDVAYVSIEGDGTTFRGRVEPANFRRLTVRVRRVDGRAFPGYPLLPAPLERLRAGILELGTKRTTNADGVLRVGIFPGEQVGFHPGLDTWTVTAGVGTSVERLDTGYTPSYVITPRADVSEPAFDVVAEPKE